MISSSLVLSDRYRLDQRLAAGGMGEVWKATDDLLGRAVAVKLLKQQYLSDETSRGRFRAEARFAASLQHSGIAQVYDYGEHDDLAYLVMELVPGQTLSRMLTVQRRLGADASLDILIQAARALQIAHAAGIIHRDIKPANLMVTADGIVKITDFGIARGGDSTTTTQTGQVMGTAQYVSPEQATGERVTPASDLYSLGIVAYECLAGLPPFAADTPVALALKHVREDAPLLPADVPPAVRELVGAMMAKDPADRPSGAQEVADQAQFIRDSLVLGDDAPTARRRALQTGAQALAADGDARPRATQTGAHARTMRTRIPPGAARIEASPDATEETPVSGARRRTRLLLAAASAVILLGAGVFTVGMLWKDAGHTKLVDGNRVAPTGPTAPKKRMRREPVGVPTGRPTPSVSVPSPVVSAPAPSPTTSAPTTKPTKTTRPPQRTPTTPATDSPPTSPDPTASGSTQGPLGSEGRV